MIDQLVEAIDALLPDLTLVAIATMLDPEEIIVGGSTAEAGEDLRDPVRERMAAEVLAPPALFTSALGPDAQLFGAIFSALRQREPGPRASQTT